MNQILKGTKQRMSQPTTATANGKRTLSPLAPPINAVVTDKQITLSFDPLLLEGNGLLITWVDENVIEVYSVNHEVIDQISQTSPSRPIVLAESQKA